MISRSTSTVALLLALVAISDANAQAPKTLKVPIYRWITRADAPVGPVNGIVVKTSYEGGRLATRFSPLNKSTAIPFFGDRLLIDLPGTKNVQIHIDPLVGHTTYAGLSLLSPCVLRIESDGALVASRAGVRAFDSHNFIWISRLERVGKVMDFAFVPTDGVYQHPTPPDASAAAAGKISWTDVKGRKITAILISHDARKARMRINGVVHEVPVANLCEEDRQYLTSLTMARQSMAAPGEVGAKWQNDLTELRRLVGATLAPIMPDPAEGKLADSNAEEKVNKVMNDLKGHQVVWEITFRGLEQQTRTPGSWDIKFDEESLIEALDVKGKKGERPSKEEMTAQITRITVISDPAVLDQWRKLPTGESVRCRGVIAKSGGGGRLIYFGGNLRDNFVWMPYVVIENAVPVNP